MDFLFSEVRVLEDASAAAHTVPDAGEASALYANAALNPDPLVDPDLQRMLLLLSVLILMCCKSSSFCSLQKPTSSPLPPSPPYFHKPVTSFRVTLKLVLTQPLTLMVKLGLKLT